MKIEKITYQQTFPTGAYMNQKLGIEIEVGLFDQGSVEEIFATAKEMCESAFKKLNPHVGEVVTYGDSNAEHEYSPNGNTIGSGIATIIQDPKEKRKEEVVDGMIATIGLSRNKTSLERFRKRVEDLNDERLTAAFKSKLEELV